MEKGSISRPLALRVASQLASHLWTLFLFTKSDIKTTVIPITCFAVAASPNFTLTHLPDTVFWIWFHVLQFDVSNQTLNPEEDEQNKRDRPLPSKRITWRNALIFRWVLVPLCFGLSLLYSMKTFYASVMLVVFTVIYNEMSAHAGHWIIRNVVNACGFVSFEMGATLVASRDRNYLDWVAILSLCISAGIFATTIQAQDFKDVEGDRAIGRQTLPIVFPGIARYTILVCLSAWTLSLIWVWRLDLVTAMVFAALAVMVVGRYQLYDTVPEDQVSFYWYNVWLSMAHALPWFYRHSGISRGVVAYD